ncbi:hypothetical protein C0992_001827 [Termitomyces sp. T32_za158]|nr:hypothetical protein C0992_001827 [Termitomyces sp. T32_za158]
MAPIQFNTEDSDNELLEGHENNDDAVGDISTILQEHHERQAKKASARASAFQMQKKAIYAAARKAAQDVSKAGVAHIEYAVTKMQELRNEEVLPEKMLADYEQLLRFQEEASTSLLSRSAERSNPSRREAALRKFSKSARIHVEEARENEKVATDASELIKHYKNLLRA